MKTTTLNVKGMTCMGCVNSLTKALSAVSGVTKVEVSKEQANARIEYDETKTNEAQFKTAIEEAGYDVL